MSKGLITTEYISNIADAIRTKRGTLSMYKPSEMANAILTIPSASLYSSTFTVNGIYTPAEGFDGFSTVTVSVPSASARVSEISITDNGIYTPATGWDGFNRVTVSVSTGTIHTQTLTLSSVYSTTKYDMGSSHSYRYISTSGLYKPTGTSIITSNGIYDIKTYANVSVYIAPTPAKVSEITVTTDGIYTPATGWDGFSKVTVSVGGVPRYAVIAGEFSSSTITTFEGLDVLYVDTYAFAYCSNLSTINIPSCKFIGASAFTGCVQLESISVNLCTNVSKYAFYNCSSLTKATLGGNIQTLDSYCFQNCVTLSSVYLTNCVNIENNALYGCSSLVFDTINMASLVKIGNSAFANCTNLAPNGLFITASNLATIGSYAFSNCGLISIGFGALNNLSIGQAAFRGNPSLSRCTGATNAAAIKEIGSSAFAGCANLSTFAPSILGTVQPYAFSGCTALTSIYGNYITSIGSNAFRNCTNLTNLYSGMGFQLFNRLSYIGSYAFSGCTNLSQIILPSTVICTLANSNAFTGTGITATLGTIGVPSALLSYYKTATQWQYFSNIMVSYTI